MFETDQRWNRRLVLWTFGLQLLVSLVLVVLSGVYFGNGKKGVILPFVALCLSLFSVVWVILHTVFLRVKLLRPSPVFFINIFHSICWACLVVLCSMSLHVGCVATDDYFKNCGVSAGFILVSLLGMVLSIWFTAFALITWVKTARRRDDAQLQLAVEARQQNPNYVPAHPVYG